MQTYKNITISRYNITKLGIILASGEILNYKDHCKENPPAKKNRRENIWY